MSTYTFFTSYLENSTICQFSGENSIDAMNIWASYITKESGFKRINKSILKKKLNSVRMHKLFDNIWQFRVTVNGAPIFVYLIKTSEERDQGNYVHEDAVEVTYANLPKSLKLKFDMEDINLIIDLKFQYLVEIGYYTEKPIPDNEPDPFENYEWDTDIIGNYVIKHAIKHDKYYSKKDVEKVFLAEEIYMKEIGILEEDGINRLLHLPINPN